MVLCREYPAEEEGQSVDLRETADPPKLESWEAGFRNLSLNKC